MSARRHIVFLTGTRADFGKLKPLIRRVGEVPHFECTIFATGMHMLARYGLTINEIYKAGFSNVFPFYNQDSTAETSMEGALANTIQGLSHLVRERRPDLIVVHGDRVETLAGAIVGALNNTLVAHVEGGELSGTVDELIRHSVTKLAHAHFVANDEAAGRLAQMGERPESVWVVGSPDIDVMLGSDLPELSEVREHYDIPFEDYGILLYHPVTTEVEHVERRARHVVDAVLASGRSFVVISPNNDLGSDQIMSEYRRLADPARFRHLPSMRFEAFLTLLRNAAAIVGNSSAGIREAPVYGVQTINLGSRQSNRFRHASIVDISEDDPALAAHLREMGGRYPSSNHFGDGRSADLFMDALSSERFWRTPRQKQFLDQPRQASEVPL
jgi:UDP-N-acetylglucosamine 2-epimerase (hydrolysing)